MPRITCFAKGRATLVAVFALVLLLAVAPVLAHLPQTAAPDFAAIDTYVEQQMRT